MMFALPHSLQVLLARAGSILIGVLVLTIAAWVFSKTARRFLNKRLLKGVDQGFRLLWKLYLKVLWRPLCFILTQIWQLVKKGGVASRDVLTGLIGVRRATRAEREEEEKEARKARRREEGEVFLEGFEDPAPPRTKTKTPRPAKAPKAPKAPRTPSSKKPTPPKSRPKTNAPGMPAREPSPTEEFEFPEL